MPSFISNPFSNFFKRLLQVNQATNTGVDATTRNIQDGDGNNTSISLSDDSLFVKPQNDNTTRTLAVQNSDGDIILSVDTTNSRVNVGKDQARATTLFKEMGLYDFSPTSVGYHYTLIANTMHFESAYAGENDWGNGVDPPTALDVSGITASENAVAVYWYLQNNITLDEVRYMATADGTATLNFHLFAYDLDVTTNHGDLSNGVVHANASETATFTLSETIKTGTFTLDTADIDVNKVVVGFVENASSTSDVSVAFTIKYHIR